MGALYYVFNALSTAHAWILGDASAGMHRDAHGATRLVSHELL